MKCNRYFAICLFATMSAIGNSAIAQSYPSKPVRIIAPYPPGGGVDVLARLVGNVLSKSLGQQFFVENRAGASGRIGTEFAARATPDGYTLLMATSGPSAILPAIYTDLTYDPISGFAPISLVASADYMLVVHPSLPAKSIKELIALAKARPNAIPFASTGTFGAPHMAFELLQNMAKIRMIHVPFKGATPAVTSVLTGETSVMFVSGLAGITHAQSGRVRALAISGEKESAHFPDLPPVSKTLPGFGVSQWYGFMAIGGTPSGLVERLNAEIIKAVKHPEVQEQIARQRADVVTSTPGEFAALVRKDIDTWQRVVKAAGLKP